MISDELKGKIAEALKAKDQLRVSTLRMLSSELHNKRIDKQEDLNKDDEIEVVQKEIKKRRDAIDAYKKAGALEKSQQEEKELEILKDFLPKQLDETELVKLVEEAIEKTSAENAKDMGKVIGYVLGKAAGKVEGSRVAKAAKEKLIK